MTDWTEISVFDGLDLSESFVLSWHLGKENLCFEVEFMVCESHPAYNPPPPGEWACYERGKLEFPNVIRVSGLRSMGSVQPAIDANGERDYGHFDTFAEVRSGEFIFAGDFGEVCVVSQNPMVKLGANAT